MVRGPLVVRDSLHASHRTRGFLITSSPLRPRSPPCLSYLPPPNESTFNPLSSPSAVSDEFCNCAKDVDPVEEEIEASQEIPLEYGQTGEPLPPVVAAPEFAK